MTGDDLPLLEYYRRHGISPVAQDISDLERHVRRRDSLYRLLGLPPRFLAGRSVLEFGPGSGHNSLVTAGWGPARYVLVDGNPRALAECRDLLAVHGRLGPAVTLVESRFEDFRRPERFDLVLAEGCLPFQLDPEGLLDHVAGFVAPGGLLVITTVSPLSIAAEIIRRLMCRPLIDPALSLETQLARLRPLLAPHLAALSGRSRPVDDWLLDNILHPFHETRCLALAQAIDRLADRFDVLGGSPAFWTDFRWYKTLTQWDRGFNAVAREASRRSAASLIDHRVVIGHQPDQGDRLEAAATDLWQVMCTLERRRARDPAPAAAAVKALADHLALLGAATLAPCLDALREAEDHLAGRLPAERMTAFPALWGRGQQYLSLIRRADAGGCGADVE